MKRILMLVLLFVHLLVNAATYHISNAGNDSNSGLTTVLAWRTIAKVNASTFTAGDSILFKCGDMWREQLTVPSSGSSGNRIIFSKYGTGSNPNILGSELAKTWTNQGGNVWKSATVLTQPWTSSGNWTANIFFVSTDLSIGTGTLKSSTANLTSVYDWYWESNSIYVYSITNPSTAYNSIEVTQRDKCINLNQKNYIEINGINTFFSESTGIHGGQSSPTPLLTGLWIHNVESAYHGYPNNGGYGISIVSSNSLIEDNEIHDCGRRGVSIGLFGDITIHDITIRNNHFYHGYHTTSVDIQADSGTGVINNIYIEKNLIEEIATYNPVSNPMLMYISEQSGTNAVISNIFLTYNVFKYPTGAAINIEHISSLYLYNNTFYGHNEVRTDGSYFLFMWGTVLTAKNNIFYSQLNEDSSDKGLIFDFGTGNTITSDYNIYYRMATNLKIANFNGTYKTMADSTTIRSLIGDAHSKFVDPKFVSPDDLSLQVNSPAINAGLNVGLTTDYLGHTVSGLPDVGAYEYHAPSTTIKAATLPNGRVPLKNGKYLKLK